MCQWPGNIIQWPGNIMVNGSQCPNPWLFHDILWTIGVHRKSHDHVVQTDVCQVWCLSQWKIPFFHLFNRWWSFSQLLTSSYSAFPVAPFDSRAFPRSHVVGLQVAAARVTGFCFDAEEAEWSVVAIFLKGEPSGKDTKKHGKSAFAKGKINFFLWQSSIANCWITRGYGDANDLNEHKPMWWEQNLHENWWSNNHDY